MESILNQEMINLIKNRRSINYFDPNRQVDDEILKQVMELASTAPSSYNIQPWKIIIVKDKDTKKILKEICYNQQKVEDASVNIVVLANTKAGIQNADKIIENFLTLGYIDPSKVDNIKQSIINSWNDYNTAYKRAIRDSAMFAMNIMISARIFGLETHPIEGYDEKKLKEFFKIPDYLIPIMIICMGYKDQTKTLLPQAYRFSFQEICQIT